MNINTLDMIATGRMLDFEAAATIASREALKFAVCRSSGARRIYIEQKDSIRLAQERIRQLTGQPCPRAYSDGLRERLKAVQEKVTERKFERADCYAALKNCQNLAPSKPAGTCALTVQKVRRLFQTLAKGTPNEGITPFIESIAYVGWDIRFPHNNASHESVRRNGFGLRVGEDWNFLLGRLFDGQIDGHLLVNMRRGDLNQLKLTALDLSSPIASNSIRTVHYQSTDIRSIFRGERQTLKRMEQGQ